MAAHGGGCELLRRGRRGQPSGPPNGAGEVDAVNGKSTSRTKRTASTLARNKGGRAPDRAEGSGAGLEALEAMGLGRPEQSQEEEVAGD
ncbi:hypothetical protein TRIUR3_24796 [Triticum urartu]|uniref:Uncharacterized protein n=1 Tax=Triticum urartu TaxID=4572 RepID=M8ABJ3_TRIUA|nr:hypothetical protein TRIUR3_24796 [Triticum urartu]